MKELSIEEKAKRYDEAIEIAKSNYDTIVGMGENCTFAKEGIVNTFHHMFPELKESEDERNIKDLIDELKCSLRAANCQNDACGGGHEKRIALLEWSIAWLEKQGEQNPAWSEEDKAMLTLVMVVLSANKDDEHFTMSDTTVEDCFNWFKSLKDRVQPQPKQEWSEEDKKIIDRIESEFLALHRGDYKNIDFNDVDSLSVLNWVRKIKSLCFYYRWKPSDKQMKLLREVQQALLGKDCHNRFVDFMYELKRLREE